MRALRMISKGELAKLACTEVAVPMAGPDEALVRVRAASINPSDFKNAQGVFPATTYPRTPGRDYAGVVESAPAAREWEGCEVWGGGGRLGFTRDGTHAEMVVVPVASLRAKPASLSMEQAACGLSFLTAYAALIVTAKLSAGERVLITGARGAVGSAAMQIASWAGALPLGIDRDNAVEIARLAQEHTRGGGMAVVFDCVGGPLFEPALATLGLQGRQVCITSVPNRRVEFDLLDFYHRRLLLVGVDTLAMSEREGAEMLDRLAAGFDAGALQGGEITRVVSLKDAAEVYRGLAAGKLTGKTVIVP